MKGSLERVRRLVAGQKPDRIPLFDLIPNDAVLQYFNAGKPVPIGDDRAGIRAIAEATDATRFSYFAPMAERVETLPDGQQKSYRRWTIWTEPPTAPSSDAYREMKKLHLADWRRVLDGMTDPREDPSYQRHRELRSWFGDDYYFLLYGPCPELMKTYQEVGLEMFCYYLCDCEEVIAEQLEMYTERACRWIAALPDDDPFEMLFIGEDIAFKTGPMVSPAWLRREYFPRLKRVIDAIHARGKKAMFHSDGNLNTIMDDLVAAGIDVLNPVEIMAGMNVEDLHRRYPKLIFAGAIDVSHLLPFGTPQQVKDAVVKTIEDAEGQILVGSSTEVIDRVPLANFLAMREVAMGYRL